MNYPFPCTSSVTCKVTFLPPCAFAIIKYQKYPRWPGCEYFCLPPVRECAECTGGVQVYKSAHKYQVPCTYIHLGNCNCNCLPTLAEWLNESKTCLSLSMASSFLFPLASPLPPPPPPPPVTTPTKARVPRPVLPAETCSHHLVALPFVFTLPFISPPVATVAIFHFKHTSNPNITSASLIAIIIIPSLSPFVTGRIN